jgi:hypothetical protein
VRVVASIEVYLHAIGTRQPCKPLSRVPRRRPIFAAPEYTLSGGRGSCNLKSPKSAMLAYYIVFLLDNLYRLDVTP